ncbi:MAG: MiaB/RimO family radical SAM methylthiotransferase [Filifactoraceae bacterium]
MEKIYISTLGCAKNLVDSEVMMGLMLKEGYEKVDVPDEANIIVVNTCGFIESAKEESINEILEMSKFKDECLKYLIVAGCLSQRYSAELEKEIPEVDAFVGTTSFESIVEVLGQLKSGKKTNLIKDINLTLREDSPREISRLGGLGYLKIAEGCDNLCTYCIIPKLRGRYRSRAIEDILKEARLLSKSGVRELVVIAQDTTKYGIDNYGEKRLGYLLRELNKIEELNWIRVLYSYPEDVDMNFIKAVAELEKVFPYFDIPIQHASNPVLKRMNRKTSK